MSANWGNVELKITIDKTNLTNDVINAFKDCQSTADNHKITYQIAGDKSSLDTMLKQVQALNPEIRTKMALEFDKSYYQNELARLKNFSNQTSEDIGNNFKKNVEKSLTSFNISDIIGKDFSKVKKLTTDDIESIKHTLKSLTEQTSGFDLSKVTSVKDIEDQALALGKIQKIFQELSTIQNTITFDGIKLNIEKELDSSTTNMNSLMRNVGEVIKTNSSQWAATLESTFNTEFANIISLFNNLKDVIGGVLGPSSNFDGDSSKMFDTLQTKINETTEEIQELQAELDSLSKKKDQPIESNKSDVEGKKRAIARYAADYKTQLEANTEHRVNAFKSLVNEYMQLGGKLDDIDKSSKSYRFIEALGIEQIVPQNAEVIKQIDELTSKMNALKVTRDNLISQQQSVTKDVEIQPGQTSHGLPPGTTADTNVTPKLSGDFKQKLQEQVDALGAVDTTVNGKLSQDFLSNVQGQADKIGTVKMGVDFGKAKETESQKIPVDVIATPKLQDTFKDDLQKLIDETGKYTVSVGANKDNQKDAVSVKTKVENGEEFKNQLKQTVEGTDGLDVKVKPFVDDGFELEIKNAVLKGVKVEGTIEGGSLKPTSVDTSSSVSSTTSTTATDNEVQQQKHVQQELEKTKQKHQEVEKTVKSSSIEQKRSLLEVVKELTTVRKKYDELQQSSYKIDISSFSDSKRKEIEKEYTDVQKLIEKIQLKFKDRPDGNKDSLINVAQYYSAMIMYVERLQALQGKDFSFDVLGENGEQKFASMQGELDRLAITTKNSNEEFDKLKAKVLELQNLKSELEKTATGAEKLEEGLFKAVKKIEELKATNKKGDLINIDSKAFNTFFNKWKEYKTAGGTRNISDFTDEVKVINSVNKAYDQMISKEIELNAKRKEEAVRTKTTFAAFNKDIDMSQFDHIFKKIESGALTVEQATARINEGIKKLRKQAEKPIVQSETLVKDDVQKPKVDPNKPTKPLGNGEVIVTPKVEDPSAFASQVTEQLKGQYATIDVKPNVNITSDGDNTILSTEIQQAESLRGKLEEVKTAVDNKTNAFKTELQVVGNSIPQEISMIEELRTQLAILLVTLEKIQKTPIKLNLTTSEEFLTSESNVNTLVKDLKTSLEGLNSDVLKNLTNVLHALNIKESVATNVQRLANAVLNLKSNLNNVSPGSTDFLNSIKELVAEGSKLKDLAVVLNATKEQISQAKDAIKPAETSDTQKVFDVQVGTKEWELLREEALKYKDVLGDIQRITYSMRQDTKGKQLKSYKIIGSKSSATVGENGKLVAEKETHEFTKTAKELNKIRDNFIAAANKSNISFNLDLLKVDEHGVITFTSTVEKAGQEAVTTKYKIKDLYETLEKGIKNNGQVALNKDGSLNKLFLNNNIYGSITSKDLTGDYTEEEKSSLIEGMMQVIKAQEREDERIKKRNELLAEGKAQEEAYYAEQKKIREEYIDFWDTSIKKMEEEQKLAGQKQNKESKASYEKEIALRKQLNEYKIKNIPDNADKSWNNNIIQDLEQQIKLEQEKRKVQDLNTEERNNNLLEVRKQLLRDLAQAQRDYNNKLNEQQVSSNKKANQKSAYSLSDINDVKSTLENTTLGNSKAVYESSKIGTDGKGTITFIEQVGNASKISTVYVEDLADALNRISNGKFDYNGLKVTQTEKDNSGKSIVNGIDMLIKKREEEAKSLSANLKAQMEARVKAEDEINDVNYGKNLSDAYAQAEENNKREKQYLEERNKLLAEGEAQEKAYYNEVKKERDNYTKFWEKALLKQDRGVNTEEATSAIQQTRQLLQQAFKPDIQGFESSFDRAETKIKNLNNELRSGTISNIYTYSDKVNKILQDLNNVVGVTDPFNGTNPEVIDEAEAKIRKYVETLSTGKITTGAFNKNTGTMLASFEKEDGTIQEVTMSWNKLTGEISATPGKVGTAKSALYGFIDGLKKRFASLAQYLMTFVSFYRIWGAIKNGITVIRDLDTALTEMRKVSDETVKSLKEFQDVSFDIASNIGSTAKQIQNSAADFMRLGYGLKEASSLAKDANIYANVGDMEIDEATEHMISSIKAWSSEFANDTEASAAIVDRYNEIGNNFAITSADIGAAMERSAAALKAGGNTLNEALGLITAGNLIQQDAETTANALKVVSLRIRGSKTELEDMGEETDGLASSTSKLRKEIMALSGVDIMKDDNTYKSTAEIIKEIGAVYESMTDVSQASLLEKLAGKTRASTVAGLLENYKVIDEVIQSAEQADGSAIEENLRYMESIEGKVAKFTNEVQEFWYTLIDSNTVKGFIDLGTNVVDVIGNITKEFGALGLVVAGSGIAYGISALKNGGGRTKKFVLIAKYATESFSREVCEIKFNVHWYVNI